MIAYHKDNPPSDVVRESVEHKVHHRFLIQLVQLLLWADEDIVTIINMLSIYIG